MPHDGFPYPDEKTPGNFAYKGPAPAPEPTAPEPEPGAGQNHAEQTALKLAAIVGKLCAALGWVVDREGECLGDHPRQLALARKILAEARELLESSVVER